MPARINREEVQIAKGPFSYEFIPTRTHENWRIRDSLDNAIGGAETEQDAIAAVERLNREN